MSQRTLVIDTALSAIVAVLLIVLSPGLAVVAIVALLTLVVVGMSLLAGHLGTWVRQIRRRHGARPPF